MIEGNMEFLLQYNSTAWFFGGAGRSHELYDWCNFISQELSAAQYMVIVHI
jgi:hypothetical protein